MNFEFIKKDKIGCYIRSGKWLLRPIQSTQFLAGMKVEVISSPDKEIYIVSIEQNTEQWLACSDFLSYIAVRRQYRNDYGEIFEKLYAPIFAGKNAVYDQDWKNAFKTTRECKQKYITNKRNLAILNYFRNKKYNKNKS